MDVALEVDGRQVMPRTAKELSPNHLAVSGDALLLQVLRILK